MAWARDAARESRWSAAHLHYKLLKKPVVDVGRAGLRHPENFGEFLVKVNAPPRWRRLIVRSRWLLKRCRSIDDMRAARRSGEDHQRVALANPELHALSVIASHGDLEGATATLGHPDLVLLAEAQRVRPVLQLARSCRVANGLERRHDLDAVVRLRAVTRVCSTHEQTPNLPYLVHELYGDLYGSYMYRSFKVSAEASISSLRNGASRRLPGGALGSVAVSPAARWSAVSMPRPQ